MFEYWYKKALLASLFKENQKKQAKSLLVSGNLHNFAPLNAPRRGYLAELETRASKADTRYSASMSPSQTRG